MPHPFALFTDSTIDEDASYFTKHDIRCVPLSFTIDGRTMEEDGSQPLSLPAFYGLLRAGKQAATAQARLDTFFAAVPRRARCGAGRAVYRFLLRPVGNVPRGLHGPR